MAEVWMAYECPETPDVWHVEPEDESHDEPRWRSAYFSQESAEDEARRRNAGPGSDDSPAGGA